MCGGCGTRLRGADGAAARTEKPLVEIGGESMLVRVTDALRGSRIGRDGTVYAAVSPHAPDTAARAREVADAVVETPGEGYVADLTTALDAVGRPVLTVPADLPLLASAHVDDALARATGGTESESAASADDAPTSLTVCVPAALKRRLGASVDTAFEHDGREVAPTGLNVVAGDDDTVALTYDARLAVNVNRPADRALAEALCA
ncbi:cobalamin biosynthesis protein CobY [Halobellus sp. Atlit-31R]|nr:cobalamin biosynthesis protein CobY [Halobellus sp. Atlit-31R]